MQGKHCVKSVPIRSFSGPYFPAFGPNTDQKNSEYGKFSPSDVVKRSKNMADKIRSSNEEVTLTLGLFDI